jgi:hypothetical protein
MSQLCGMYWIASKISIHSSFASWGAAIIQRAAPLEMNEGPPLGSGSKKPKWLKGQRTPPATFTFTLLAYEDGTDRAFWNVGI